MSTKKPRKSLDNALAQEFVYGRQDEPELVEGAPDQELKLKELPQELPLELPQKEPDLMTRLQTPPKEATVRFTVDLPESMHRRLSILAAKTGKKKADIVRVLLDQEMKDLEE